MTPTQLFVTATLPLIITIFAAVWIQNRQFDMLGKRIDDLRADMNARFSEIANRLERLEQRIERLEQPRNIVRG